MMLCAQRPLIYRRSHVTSECTLWRKLTSDLRICMSQTWLMGARNLASDCMVGRPYLSHMSESLLTHVLGRSRASDHFSTVHPRVSHLANFLDCLNVCTFCFGVLPMTGTLGLDPMTHSDHSIFPSRFFSDAFCPLLTTFQIQHCFKERRFDLGRL